MASERTPDEQREHDRQVKDFVRQMKAAGEQRRREHPTLEERLEDLDRREFVPGVGWPKTDSPERVELERLMSAKIDRQMEVIVAMQPLKREVFDHSSRLILDILKWRRIDEGARRRSHGAKIRKSIALSIAEITALVPRVLDGYGSVEMGVVKDFRSLAEMVGSEEAKSWPDGLTDEHLDELEGYRIDIGNDVTPCPWPAEPARLSDPERGSSPATQDGGDPGLEGKPPPVAAKIDLAMMVKTLKPGSKRVQDLVAYIDHQGMATYDELQDKVYKGYVVEPVTIRGHVCEANKIFKEQGEPTEFRCGGGMVVKRPRLDRDIPSNT